MKRRDLAWAAAAALAVFTFFVITLRPDVGGTEDSPKFQFVGRVLGTSHSPGYPFYSIATYVFGWIPVGNLAYRINLFSAVCGALACACVYLTARRLGVTRLLALAAAAAAATSYPLWSNSVTAEVYSLGAFLSALSILLVIGFGQTGQVWRLYAGCAAWACGFGNHLTIAAILPAALAYGVYKDRRVLQPRIALTAAAIGIAGVLQYAFIAIRTFQGAPYLEARATTVMGVFDVIIARDVSWARFYQAQTTVAQIEVPMLLNGVRANMGTIPVALVLIAIALGIKRRNAEVMVVLGAAAGTLAFIANLWGDVVGFITPVCVQLFPLAALGLQELVDVVQPATDMFSREQLLAASGIVAMTFPVLQGVQLWPSINALRQPGEGPGVRALYSHLPQKSAVVAENYWLARLVNYMHFSGEVRPDPNPRVLDNDVVDVRTAIADGLTVFSFEGASQWLNAQGFRFEPTAMARQPLPAWLSQQEPGTLLIAATAGRALPFDWLPKANRAQRPAAYSVFLTTVGGDTTVDQNDTAVKVTRLSGDGRAMTIAADDAGPQISVGDDVIVALDRGMAVAAFSPEGAVIGRWTFSMEETPGFEFPPFAYQLAGANPNCLAVPANSPVDVTSALVDGRASIGIDGYGKGTISLEGAALERGRLWITHGRGETSIDAAHSTLVLNGYQGTRPVFAVTTPPPAGTVTATLHSDQITTARLCRVSVPSLPDTGALAVDALRDGFFGAGWHLAERAGTQQYRWSGRHSTLTWRMARADDVRLRLRVRPAHADGATLSASINGTTIQACSLKAGQWSDCTFTVPAASVVSGVNQLTLDADTMAAPAAHPGDARELAFVMQASRVRVGK